MRIASDHFWLRLKAPSMAAVKLYDFEVSPLIILLRIVKEVRDVLRFMLKGIKFLT